MDDIVIRDAEPGDLCAGAALLAASLEFSDRDAIPAWLMQTAVACGGIALAAVAGGELAGFSFALPADDRTLFSCGLAVAPAHRGARLGHRLKLAQRERALGRGVTTIRWTADPLAAHALSVYLSGLGARLDAYEPGLYADVRPAPVPPDDVVIDWPLLGAPAFDPATVRRVEIPFAHAALADGDRLAWRLRVRDRMCRALDAGLVGTGVQFDRRARRSWVLFARPA
jgi:predicted GNAT superfamily acetyltransferase